MATAFSVTTIFLLIVFVLGSCWLSSAELTSSLHSTAPLTMDGVIIMPEEEYTNDGTISTTMERMNATHLNNACDLCLRVTKGILKLLRSNKFKTRIMSILHASCSLLFKLKPKCIAKVNAYALVFFTLVQIAQPRTICHSVHLCSQNPANSTINFLSEDKCNVCRYVVAEFLAEMKYPNKKLEIMMESVLKTYVSKEGGEEFKSEILNSEFVPMIMANTKSFFVEKDLCVMSRACLSRSSSTIDF